MKPREIQCLAPATIPSGVEDEEIAWDRRERIKLIGQHTLTVHWPGGTTVVINPGDEGEIPGIVWMA